RVRQAQNDVVFMLHQKKDANENPIPLSATLVPSLPSDSAPDIPARWLWTKDDAAGFVQLANRLAIAAFDSINFPPSPPETSRDIPIVKPEPENKEDVTLVKVLLPDAGDGWCEQGTAILEVHYSNEKDRQDCWHTIGLPDLRNRRLEIVSGA